MYRHVFHIIFFCLLMNFVSAQENEKYISRITDLDPIDDLKIFSRLEVLASFPGGPSSWFDFVKANLKKDSFVYYLNFRKQETDTVLIKFVVDREGHISHCKFLKSVHPEVQKSILNLLRKSPHWQPGMNGGRYLNSFRTLGFSFSITGNDVVFLKDFSLYNLNN